MKRIILLLISAVFCLGITYAQTAEDLLQKGAYAIGDENYEEAKLYFEKAAELGSGEACGFLAVGYLHGIYEGGRNLSLASQWATKGAAKKDGTSTYALGIMNFYMADSKKEKAESLDLLLFGYNNGAPAAYVGNLIAVCYLLKGKREDAKNWATIIKDKEKDEEDKDDYYTASAILAKILLDEKDYTSAMVEGLDAAKYGDPLAQYVVGRSQIKLDFYPSTGKNRVYKATQYKYIPFTDIDVFADEIQEYYNTIRYKEFKDKPLY